MEVKICQQTKEIKNAGFNTSLFETASINYEHIRYENLEEFNILLKSRLGNNNYTPYGIPQWMYDKKLPEKECKSGHFLLISFHDDNDYSYIVCKNCIIYVTNHGQTVDKIIVE